MQRPFCHRSTFDPTSYQATSASYIVSLPNTVRSAGGGLMQQPLQFSFTTAPPVTAGPVVLRSFPAQGATAFGAAMGFHVTFNEPVVFASFSGRVAVTDLDSSRNVQLGTVQYADVDDGGVLSFAPLGALRYGGRYRLAFLPGLRDILGNGSSTEHRVDFTVEPAAPPQGSTVEGFETIRRWQQPCGAPGSTGLDSAGTSFTLTVERRKSGVYAGKVAYTFAGAAGAMYWSYRRSCRPPGSRSRCYPQWPSRSKPIRFSRRARR